MSKQIAIFCSSFKLGGVEKALINLANSLVDDGYHVQFIVSLNEGILKNELSENVEIVDLRCKKLRNSFFKLYRYIKKTKLDVLITGPTYPNIIAIICNLFAFGKMKIIATQHSYHDVEMKSLGLVGRLAPFLIKLTYKFSYKVVAVSNGVKLDLVNNYKINPEKINVIYNAVLSDSFFKKSNEPIEEFILNQILNDNYLIAVGRLEIVKNYPFLINIYSKMKSEIPDFNYNLVILGDGIERLNLEKQIKDLGIENNVHILGAVSNPLPLIKKAKALLHSSFSEAMPLVYVEALALKVPVVTTINNGALEVLEGIEQKLILNSYDENFYIDGLLKILENCDFSNAPNLEKFHANKIKDSFLALI